MEDHTKWYLGAFVLGLLTLPISVTIIGPFITVPLAIGCWVKGKRLETDGEWAPFWSDDSDWKPFWLPEDEASAPWWQKSFGQLWRERKAEPATDSSD